MNTGWLIGIVVSAVACVFTYLGWREGRRRRLRWTHTFAPLAHGRTPGSPGHAAVERVFQSLHLRLEVGGEFNARTLPVEDPYVCTVTFGVVSRPDIPKAAFNDEPLKFDFGVPVVWLAAIDGHPHEDEILSAWQNDAPAWGRSTVIDIPPALIALGKPWTITLIVDGEPTVNPATSLTDVTWIHGEPLSLGRRAARNPTPLAVLAMGCLIVMLPWLGGLFINGGGLRWLGLNDTSAALPVYPTLSIRGSVRSPHESITLVGQHFPQNEILQAEFAYCFTRTVAYVKQSPDIADANGSFVFTWVLTKGVPPGAYTLSIYRVPDTSGQQLATADLTVGGRANGRNLPRGCVTLANGAY